MPMAPVLVRARLGVVLPGVNTVVEPWFNAVCPRGVRIHASRMFLANHLTPEAVVRMDREEGMLAVRQIASCKPASIAYCCTASSIVQGLEYDNKLAHEIAEAAGVPATTATRAIIEALHVLGARRLSIASPYTKQIDDAEHAFFGAAGFGILGSAHLGIADSFRLAEPDAASIMNLAMNAWHPDADALLITCLNLSSHEVIEALEQSLKKPVVTSTQATLWKALRLAGINDRIPGYGRLLSEF
jgi:maleate isomerase